MIPLNRLAKIEMTQIFKTIAMDNGVNFTAGLSVVRTSPDHGTAYDLAGQNMASENSFRQALYMAIDVYKNRNNK